MKLEVVSKGRLAEGKLPKHTQHTTYGGCQAPFGVINTVKANRWLGRMSGHGVRTHRLNTRAVPLQ